MPVSVQERDRRRRHRRAVQRTLECRGAVILLPRQPTDAAFWAKVIEAVWRFQAYIQNDDDKAGGTRLIAMASSADRDHYLVCIGSFWIQAHVCNKTIRIVSVRQYDPVSLSACRQSETSP